MQARSLHAARYSCMLGCMAETPPYGELVARNVAAARVRRKLNQADLAARMAAHGFKWVRQTVTEAEASRRRISVDELLWLSVALETPMDVLMFPAPGDQPYVALPGGQWIALPVAERGPSGAAREVWDRNVSKLSSGPIPEGEEG